MAVGRGYDSYALVDGAEEADYFLGGKPIAENRNAETFFLLLLPPFLPSCDGAGVFLFSLFHLQFANQEARNVTACSCNLLLVDAPKAGMEAFMH